LRYRNVGKIGEKNSLKGWRKRGKQYAGITQVLKKRVNEG
jgi:hypothetical protein